MSRTLISLIVLACLALVTFFGWKRIEAAAPEPPLRDTVVVPSLPVEVQTVVQTQPAPRQQSQGRLEEKRSADLVAEEGGRIEYVDPAWGPGAPVTEGQLLWRIADRDLKVAGTLLKARLAAAEAAREAAEFQGERAAALLAIEEERLAVLKGEEARWVALVDKGQGGASQLDLARGQRLGSQRAVLESELGIRAAEIEVSRSNALILQIEAEEEQLALRLERLEGRAPLAGILDRSAPSPGQWLLPGTAVGRVISLASPRVLFEVGDRHIDGLAIGDSVQVQRTKGSDQNLAGRMTGFGTRVEKTTGELTVEAELETSPPLWRPGQSVWVTWQSAPMPRAVYLDPGQVIWRSSGPGCFVVSEETGGERAVWQPLTLGDEVRGLLPVLEGLGGGETLITHPLGRLYDGALVRIPVTESAR